jgi:hypothetical protein
MVLERINCVVRIGENGEIVRGAHFVPFKNPPPPKPVEETFTGVDCSTMNILSSVESPSNSPIYLANMLKRSLRKGTNH